MIFDHLKLIKYDLLTLSSNQPGRRKITKREAKTGVFIERTGKRRNGYGEEFELNSILYMRTADAKDNLLDYGVEIGGISYEISGYDVGKDYQTGEIEHYKLVLTRTAYANG
jgi:hypothetical protein